MRYWAIAFVVVAVWIAKTTSWKEALIYGGIGGLVILVVVYRERRGYQRWRTFPSIDDYMAQHGMSARRRVRCCRCGSTYIQDFAYGDMVEREWPRFWKTSLCRLHWCGTCNTPLYRTTL